MNEELQPCHTYKLMIKQLPQHDDEVSVLIVGLIYIKLVCTDKQFTNNTEWSSVILIE